MSGRTVEKHRGSANISKPSRTRNWWQPGWGRLSVQALMVFVLLIGGGLGWVAYRARLQREAVAMILGAGGRVTYEDDPRLAQATDDWPSRSLLSWTPTWLVDWVAKHLGDEYFPTVVKIG